MRRWISRFNAQGIDGLIYRPRPSLPRKLVESIQQLMKELKTIRSVSKTHSEWRN